MKRLLLLPLMAALVACGHDGTGSRYDDQIRKQVDSVVYADRSVEALQSVLQGYEGEGNGYGEVAACRELGCSYRNASRFSEAVDVHKKGLAAAQEISLLQDNYETERRSWRIILITILTILAFAIVAIAFLIYNIYLRSKNQRMLKEVERTRTNFFTNITHEFRTPLTVIISAAQDIQFRNRNDRTLQRDTTDIVRHGKGLLDLVNQILDIAKITSGGGS